MSCPLFVDFTRECIHKFPEIVAIGTYGYCSSDGYKMCPFYKIIVEKSPHCEFIKNCGISFLEYFSYPKMVEMYELNPQNFLEHCLSDDKKINCAIYKYRKDGKDIPKGLLPDGRKIKLEVEK
jgi:hypothetical protein